MAQLAAAAGVTAALYYRHFPSKAELFEACMRAAAAELLSSWEEALHDPDPSAWLLRMGAAPHAEMGAPNLLALWFHATTEAPNNRDMRAMLADQLGEIHAFVARVVQQSQERPGGVRPDLDAEAEAWIFLSTGLMLATSIRVGGQMQEQLPRVVAGRRTWLYGSLKGR